MLDVHEDGSATVLATHDRFAFKTAERQQSAKLTMRMEIRYRSEG